jgi:Spy/CpxP family protein refolding chaperone
MVRMTTLNATAVVRPAQGVKHVAAGLVLAVAGTLAVSAWAQGPGAQAGMGVPGMHRMHDGAHGGGFGGHGLFVGGPERVDRAVDRMLQGLNATEEQRSQVKRIAGAAATDLRAQHEAGRSLHEQGLQLFAAPVVDARAVEALRQKRVAHHDQVSKRMTQAMLEVSAVLSPEQRAKLAERVKERQARMKERLQERTMDRRGAAAASAPVR